MDIGIDAMHKPSLLLLGYGQLNRALAEHLSLDYDITAVSRSPQTHTAIWHVAADLSQRYPASLSGAHFEQVVFCLSPADYSETAYAKIYGDALATVLMGLTPTPPKRFYLVSSTSVYRQNDDEWIDESSPAVGNGFAGQQLLKAEKNLDAAPFPGTVIRFSGIYGGERTRLIRQTQKGDFDAEGPTGYSNRIHEEDAVGIMAHLIRRQTRGQPLEKCYLASDNEPTPLHEVMKWLATQLGTEAKGRHSEVGEARRRAGSKRCSNRRILESGYCFRYPTFREGYSEMLTRLGLRTLP